MRRASARKPRLSRMHAAVDAMAPFGFTEAQVKKHVAQLLRVYGGNDAWPFIEECAYRELLEAMLRDDEDNDQENATEDGRDMKEKCIENETAVGTSCTVSDTQLDETPAPDIAQSFPTVTQPSHPKHVTSSPVRDVLPVEESRDVSKDVVQNHPSEDIEATAAVRSKSSNNPVAKISTPTKNPIRASNISSPLPAKSLATRRRLPCYGWIESDEEDIGEFISLKPAMGALPVKTSPTKRVRLETNPMRGRRSRWDEKPA